MNLVCKFRRNCLSAVLNRKTQQSPLITTMSTTRHTLAPPPTDILLGIPTHLESRSLLHLSLNCKSFKHIFVPTVFHRVILRSNHRQFFHATKLSSGLEALTNLHTEQNSRPCELDIGLADDEKPPSLLEERPSEQLVINALVGCNNLRSVKYVCLDKREFQVYQA